MKAWLVGLLLDFVRKYVFDAINSIIAYFQKKKREKELKQAASEYKKVTENVNSTEQEQKDAFKKLIDTTNKLNHN